MRSTSTSPWTTRPARRCPTAVRSSRAASSPSTVPRSTPSRHRRRHRTGSTPVRLRRHEPERHLEPLRLRRPGSNGGSIGSWDLTITTGPAPPPTCGPEMHIDAATATTSSPYPSNCTISGPAASITDVNLVLDGVYHTFPDDLDLLLVGSAGTERDRHLGRRRQPRRRRRRPHARRRGRRADSRLDADHQRGLPAGQLHAGRHLARSGAGSERRQCPVGLRRLGPERGLEPVRVRRRGC